MFHFKLEMRVMCQITDFLIFLGLCSELCVMRACQNRGDEAGKE